MGRTALMLLTVVAVEGRPSSRSSVRLVRLSLNLGPSRYSAKDRRSTRTAIDPTAIVVPDTSIMSSSVRRRAMRPRMDYGRRLRTRRREALQPPGGH
ncbi:hypothetical protein EVAR_103955_1 [Eumeta japonica]|uniref:Uncharacterized protein n=1 Tax=Eumeta variegata TaxID=151549 RepID=A0A4C1YEB8_EUMVA|nr:hypothetical protein EVAR_103955_1 [Eumeta japonica]